MTKKFRIHLSKFVFILLVILAVSIVLSSFVRQVYESLPSISVDEWELLRIPRNVDDMKSLGRVLLKYKDDNYFIVLFGVSAVYILLQSFAIPGSIFLSVLSGYLFHFHVALILVCMCSAFGALFCYLIAGMFLRRILLSFCKERLIALEKEVASANDYLIFYMIFLRVTPVLPNWFVNIASPQVKIPKMQFFFGTLIGVAPPSVFFINAGSTLEKITVSSLSWSWRTICLNFLLGFIALLPVIWHRYFATKESKLKLT